MFKGYFGSVVKAFKKNLNHNLQKFKNAYKLLDCDFLVLNLVMYFQYLHYYVIILKGMLAFVQNAGITIKESANHSWGTFKNPDKSLPPGDERF